MTTTTQHADLGDGDSQTDGGHTEDVPAQILASQIKREAKLRDIVEQSASRYFFGDTLLVISLRLVALVVFGYLYFRAGMFSSFSFWPILTLGGFIEAMRANRRVDAMLELENIKTKRAA